MKNSSWFRLKIAVTIAIICVITFGVCCGTKSEFYSSPTQAPELKISCIQWYTEGDVDEYTLAPFEKMIIFYSIKNKTEYEIDVYKLIVEIDYLDCTQKTLKEVVVQHHRDHPLVKGKLQTAQVSIRLPKEKCAFKIGKIRLYADCY